jgi:hypothetical protein
VNERLGVHGRSRLFGENGLDRKIDTSSSNTRTMSVHLDIDLVTSDALAAHYN